MYPIYKAFYYTMIFTECQVYFLTKRQKFSFCLSFFAQKQLPFFSAQAERGHKLRTRFILSGRLLFCTG